MDSLLSLFQDHKTIVTTVSIISLVFFFTSMLLLPIIISRLPDNYFTHEERLSRLKIRPPTPIEALLIALKNTLGVILILIGVAMLVLPGQGLLMIFIGFSLTNFPGKYKLERKIIMNPAVFNTLNWVRHKMGKNSLKEPS